MLVTTLWASLSINDSEYIFACQTSLEMVDSLVDTTALQEYVLKFAYCPFCHFVIHLPMLCINGIMASSNGNIFLVTGPLWGAGGRWIPLTKANDAELWCLWSAPEQTIEQTIETPVIRDAIALIMTSLWWYPNNSVITVPAVVLVPIGARPSACTVMVSYQREATSWQSYYH